MNKKEYLKSFLKPGQKRLPRKLKKLYLKNFCESGPILVYNLTQFLNLYKQDEKLVGEAIYNLLNTPVEEKVFKPNYNVDTNSHFTCELVDKSTRKLDGVELKGYLI